MSQFIDELLAASGGVLPTEYAAYLSKNGGELRPDGISIYYEKEILERNQTYEVFKYVPGYLAIGDDSGGRFIMVQLKLASPVFLLGMGCLGAMEPEEIAPSFSEWIQADCKLPE